jgi:hypothetical protein
MRQTIKALSIVLTAELFARFGLYAIRTIMFYYLFQILDASGHIDPFFISVVALCSCLFPLFAGAICDITKSPVLFSILGSAMICAACSGLCFIDSPQNVKVLFILMIAGESFVQTALFCVSYRNSMQIRPYFDLINGCMAFVFNAVAVVSGFMMALTFEANSIAYAKAAFLIGATGSLLAAILLFVFNKTLKYNDIVYSIQPFKLTKNAALSIVIMYLTHTIFSAGMTVLYYYKRAGINHEYVNQSWMAAALASMIVVPFFIFKGFRGSWKIVLGIFLATLMFGLVPLVGRVNFPIQMVNCMATVLVTPVIYSQIAQLGSPRFTGTLAGGLGVLGFFTTQLISSMMMNTEVYGMLTPVFAVLFVLLGVAVFLADYFRPRAVENI